MGGANAGGGGGGATDPPYDYLCPITLELMEDPVMTSDGDTYEKDAIEQWFSRGNNTAPRTGAVLPNLNLVRNNALRRAIETWKEQQTTAAPVDTPAVASATASTTSFPPPPPAAVPAPLTVAEARAAERRLAEEAWDQNPGNWNWGRYGCPMCGSHGPGCGYCQ